MKIWRRDGGEDEGIKQLSIYEVQHTYLSLNPKEGGEEGSGPHNVHTYVCIIEAWGKVTPRSLVVEGL